MLSEKVSESPLKGTKELVSMCDLWNPEVYNSEEGEEEGDIMVHAPVILARKRLRQDENEDFEVSLGYGVNSKPT